ncbi:MAG: DUF4388 domain-containing protein, partial [Planctomycetota bacterium]
SGIHAALGGKRMAFRGDLTNISLADIFQNIAANRLTGTLRLYNDQQERYIYFGEGEITLYSPGKKDPEWIPNILVKQRKLDEVQKSSILKAKKKTRKLLKQVLSELKILRQEDFSSLLQQYIEEEIYEVFFWKEAHFEFIEGEPPSVFDEDLQAAGIKIDSMTVIMEAARRLDEWQKIQEKIGSPHEIIQANVPPGTQNLTAIEHALIPMLDGTRSIQDIIDYLPYGKFDIFRSIYDLMCKGYARPVEMEELLKLVDRKLAENQRGEAIPILRQILERQRYNLEARQRLAEALEEEDRMVEAAEEYKIMAYQYMGNHEIQKAIHCYRRAVVLDPTDTSTQEKLLSIYLEQNRLDRAFLASRALATTYQELGFPQKACKVYETLLQYDENPEIHIHLAKAYGIANDNQEALKHYYQAARLYLKKGDEKNALATYELAKELDPSPDSEASKRIEDIQSGKYFRRRKLVKRMALLATFTPIFLVLILFFFYEALSRSFYHQAFQEVMVNLYSGHPLEAANSLASVAKAYPYSLTARDIPRQLEFLAQLAYHRAQALENKGDFVHAYFLYLQISLMPIPENEILKKAWEKRKYWEKEFQIHPQSPLQGEKKNPSSIKPLKPKPSHPPKPKEIDVLPPLKPNREAIKNHFDALYRLYKRKKYKEAKKGFQKLVLFLENQPLKLQN